MVSPSEYRNLLSHFATGVTVVTVATEAEDHGMTVNSFASVSLDPPLVLFCADTGTHTHELVPRAGHYAVNVLTADQEWLSTRFAGEHNELDDPFADVDTTRRETGAPIIEDTLAYLDCELHASHEAGDHTIYVGCVVDGGLGRSEAPPLTFYKGEYGTVE